MPDYYSYEYNRLDGEGVIKLDNPDRVIVTPNEQVTTINAIEDENVKALMHLLFPSTSVPKILHEEILENENFGDVIRDIAMSGDICSIRFSRELTEVEVTELDVLVEAHKNNA